MTPSSPGWGCGSDRFEQRRRLLELEFALLVTDPLLQLLYLAADHLARLLLLLSLLPRVLQVALIGARLATERQNVLLLFDPLATLGLDLAIKLV